MKAGTVFESIALDPQTSGGLLASVTRPVAAALVADGWWEVGEVRAGPAGVQLV